MSNPMLFSSGPAASYVVSYAVNALWQVPLVGAAGWAASRVLRRLGPQAQHVAWVATLLLAVAVPGVPRWHWPVRAAADGGSVSLSLSVVAVAPQRVSLIAEAMADVAAVVRDGVAALPGAVLILLALLYCGALLYFAARFCWSLYWTTALEREAMPQALDAESEELWRRCRQACGVGDATVLRSDRIDGPVTVGFGRPVLLVPEGFPEECSQQDLLAMLAHECAHMQRRDFQKNVLYETASLLIAFHPVTWMLKRQIAQTREMICDGMAVETLMDTAQYVRALLRMAKQISATLQGGALQGVGIFDGNILERRIRAMKTTRRHVGWAMRLGMIAAGAAVLAGVTAAGSMQAVAVEAKAAPATTSTDAGANGAAAVDATATDAEQAGSTEEKAVLLRRLAAVKEAFKERIAYANRHFGTGTTAGAKSDRGRVYIQYGKPQSIESHPSGSGEQAPYEVWHYSHLKGVGDNVNIEFTDTCRCGEYRMETDHSANAAVFQARMVAIKNLQAQLKDHAMRWRDASADALAAGQAAASPGAAQVSSGAMRGNCLSCPEPRYPPIARAAHVSGAVVLHAVIGKDGTIKDLNPISGSPMLVGPSMETVRAWRYKPYMLNGQPTGVETTITVNFSLQKEPRPLTQPEPPPAAAPVPPAPPAAPPQALGQPPAAPVPARPLVAKIVPADEASFPYGAKSFGDITMPVLTHQVEPEYSKEARKAKFSGDVIVGMYVNQRGLPVHVHVIRGVGMGLDEKAVEAVQKYRFKPAMKNGKPVGTLLKVDVNFQIF